MQLWPESATLAEDGSPNAGVGGNVSSGAGSFPPSAGGMGAPKAPNAGEIMLSRAESIALAAMETEDDEDHGFKRARAESGLADDQLRRLKRRATAAVAKGYTLKGTHLTKRPMATMGPEEPALARRAETPKKDENAGEHPMRRAEDKAKLKKAKETNAVIVRRAQEHDDLYRCQTMDYGFPTASGANEPDSGDEGQKEANTMTTLAAMLQKKRRRKM